MSAILSGDNRPSKGGPIAVQASPTYKISVPAERRFKGDHACPICGGTDDDPRGSGSRCFGFLSEDGQWAHCTRPEHAGTSPMNPGSQAHPHKLKGRCPCGREHSPADPKPAKARAKPKLGTIEAVYDYRRNDAGPVVFQAVRFRDPKDFRQRRPGADGKWVWKLDGIEPFLYRRPELLTADADELVFVVEGEKDVEALRSLGAVATCNPMGALKWRDSYSEDLRGRRIAVIPDNDTNGRNHAEMVARSAYGKAAEVRVISLPDVPEKGDVSDFLRQGGTVEGLRRLVSEARPWEPPETPAGVLKADDDPHRLARHFLRHFRYEGDLTLVSHREELHRWDGESYRPYRDVIPDLTSDIEEEFNRANLEAIRRKIEAVEKKGLKIDNASLPRAKKVTSAIVNNTKLALCSETALSWDESPPCWIEDDDRPRPDALDVLPTRSGLLDLTTLELMPKTPRFFSPFSLDYDFVPDAPPPTRWMRFVDEVFPGDAAAVRELQKWFGYLLTPDTRHHKIFLAIGPTRSGKGTIAKVLTKLIGAHNVVNPTLDTLATSFGLASMVGKSAAIFGDARIGGSASDKAVIVGRLLAISGEDPLTIPRKYKDDLTAKLNTRILIFSNESLNMRDASSAIVDRVIPFKMTVSFLGREEIGLDEKLYAELPGILKWAIRGRELLREDGRFRIPPSGQATFDDMFLMSSPVRGFVDECCEIIEGDSRAPEDLITKQDLFDAFVEWCKSGKHEANNDVVFNKNLMAAFPALVVERPRSSSGERPRRYRGINLNNHGEDLLRRQKMAKVWTIQKH